jgi:ABC-type taurine transport system ATPase subunit
MQYQAETAPAMPLLQTRNVVLRYPTARFGGAHRNGSFLALDRVSTTIDQGDFVVAIGRSGCGKTTLLNLLAGFQMPSEGQVLFAGREVAGPSAERGVVFQNDALLPWLNAQKNVEFGLRLKGRAVRKARPCAGGIGACGAWRCRRAACLGIIGRAAAARRPSPRLPPSRGCC